MDQRRKRKKRRYGNREWNCREKVKENVRSGFGRGRCPGPVLRLDIWQADLLFRGSHICASSSSSVGPSSSSEAPLSGVSGSCPSFRRTAEKDVCLLLEKAGNHAAIAARLVEQVVPYVPIMLIMLKKSPKKEISLPYIQSQNWSRNRHEHPERLFRCQPVHGCAGGAVYFLHQPFRPAGFGDCGDEQLAGKGPATSTSVCKKAVKHSAATCLHQETNPSVYPLGISNTSHGRCIRSGSSWRCSTWR